MSDTELVGIFLAELAKEHDRHPASTVHELAGQIARATVCAVPQIRAAVIEALAAEAEAEPFMDFTGNWERSSSEGFADWLRSHLPKET